MNMCDIIYEDSVCMKACVGSFLFIVTWKACYIFLLSTPLFLRFHRRVSGNAMLWSLKQWRIFPAFVLGRGRDIKAGTLCRNQCHPGLLPTLNSTQVFRFSFLDSSDMAIGFSLFMDFENWVVHWFLFCVIPIILLTGNWKMVKNQD